MQVDRSSFGCSTMSRFPMFKWPIRKYYGGNLDTLALKGFLETQKGFFRSHDMMNGIP